MIYSISFSFILFLLFSPIILTKNIVIIIIHDRKHHRESTSSRPYHSIYLEVRRSGRCRTVNSIYADSIGELKRAVKKPSLTLKKLSYKSNLEDQHESEDY